MKKLGALIFTMLIAFNMPIVAFGEEADGDEVHTAFVTDLGETESEHGDDAVFSGRDADLRWNGEIAGKIIRMEMIVDKYYVLTSENCDIWIGWPQSTPAPTSYNVGESNTVLSAVAFALSFGDKNDNQDIDAPPGGGTIEYTYQANQQFVNNLAKENGIKPSDIHLFIYQEESVGTKITGINKLVVDGSAVPAYKIGPDGPIPLKSGTFVMALACDSDLLKVKSKSEVKSNSSSETFVGIDPVQIGVEEPTLLVATGKDDGDASPKTGQSVPGETAPLAFAATGVLGATAVFASRRRSAR